VPLQAGVSAIVVTVFYLHGFASSPQSSKATFFAERLAARGIRMECLDLNQPDFSALTISRMLQQLEQRIAAIPPANIVLIGSSLGGFVAVEAAARQVNNARHPITQLILLAPAVELEWDKWTELGSGGVESWKRSGRVDVFHYGFDESRALSFAFYEDANRYHPAARRLSQPVVIFQGRHDESVSPAVVQRFAAAQPHATLHMLDDGHQLKNSLEFIWREIDRALL
jgi:pimeloyl-ACP methyl ester carboxylesterase